MLRFVVRSVKSRQKPRTHRLSGTPVLLDNGFTVSNAYAPSPFQISESRRLAMMTMWLCPQSHSNVGKQFLLLSLVSFSALLFAQDSELGRVVYTKCAKSVFVLYAQDASGEFVAQGSGFYVAGKLIVTNARS